MLYQLSYASPFEPGLRTPAHSRQRMSLEASTELILLQSDKRAYAARSRLHGGTQC